LTKVTRRRWNECSSPLGNTSEINDDEDDGGTNVPPTEEPKTTRELAAERQDENYTDLTAPT
jgi:hypothetical protein